VGSNACTNQEGEQGGVVTKVHADVHDGLPRFHQSDERFGERRFEHPVARQFQTHQFALHHGEVRQMKGGNGAQGTGFGREQAVFPKLVAKEPTRVDKRFCDRARVPVSEAFV
jgi:hypothetical protein